MFVNRRNFYYNGMPYLPGYTQAQIQQYQNHALATRAKMQAYNEAVLEAELQNRSNDMVTFVGGSAMLEAPVGPPNMLQEFPHCTHVPPRNTTPHTSYPPWGGDTTCVESSQGDSIPSYRQRFGKNFCRVLTTCSAILLVLSVLGIVGIAVYLGYAPATEEGPNYTDKYSGSIRVLQGDTWMPDLLYQDSPAFRAKATKYKNMFKELFVNSLLKSSYEDAEVIQFEALPPIPAALVGGGNASVWNSDLGFDLTFHLFLDRRKIPYSHTNNPTKLIQSLLQQEFLSPSPISFQNLKVAPTPLKIKKLDPTSDWFDYTKRRTSNPKKKYELVPLQNTEGGILRAFDVREPYGYPVDTPAFNHKPTYEYPEFQTFRPPIDRDQNIHRSHNNKDNANILRDQLNIHRQQENSFKHTTNTDDDQRNTHRKPTNIHREQENSQKGQTNRQNTYRDQINNQRDQSNTHRNQINILGDPTNIAESDIYKDSLDIHQNPTNAHREPANIHRETDIRKTNTQENSEEQKNIESGSYPIDNQLVHKTSLVDQTLHSGIPENNTFNETKNEKSQNSDHEVQTKNLEKEKFQNSPPNAVKENSHELDVENTFEDRPQNNFSESLGMTVKDQNTLKTNAVGNEEKEPTITEEDRGSLSVKPENVAKNQGSLEERPKVISSRPVLAAEKSSKTDELKTKNNDTKIDYQENSWKPLDVNYKPVSIPRPQEPEVMFSPNRDVNINVGTLLSFHKNKMPDTEQASTSISQRSTITTYRPLRQHAITTFRPKTTKTRNIFMRPVHEIRDKIEPNHRKKNLKKYFDRVLVPSFQNKGSITNNAEKWGPYLDENPNVGDSVVHASNRFPTRIGEDNRYSSEITGDNRHHSEIIGYNRYPSEVAENVRHSNEVTGNNRYPSEVAEKDRYSNEVAESNRYPSEVAESNRYPSEVAENIRHSNEVTGNNRHSNEVTGNNRYSITGSNRPLNDVIESSNNENRDPTIEDLRILIENLLILAASNSFNLVNKNEESDAKEPSTKENSIKQGSNVKIRDILRNKDIEYDSGYSGSSHFVRPIYKNQNFPLDKFRNQRRPVLENNPVVEQQKLNVEENNHKPQDIDFLYSLLLKSVPTKKPTTEGSVFATRAYTRKPYKSPSPVYIRDVQKKNRLRNEIIKDRKNSEVIIPVISGHKVKYIRINKTRSDYPNVVVVNLGDFGENDTKPEQPRRIDSENRKNFLELESTQNVRSNLVDDSLKLLSLSSIGHLDEQIHKNKAYSDENLDIKMFREKIFALENSKIDGYENLSLIDLLINLTNSKTDWKKSRRKFFPPGSHREGKLFTNFFTKNKNRDRAKVKRFEYDFYGPNRGEFSENSKLAGNRPTKYVTKSKFSGNNVTLFLIKSEDGRDGKVISVSNIFPSSQGNVAKMNSPIHVFTFKENQSLDQLLAEIFNTLYKEDGDYHSGFKTHVGSKGDKKGDFFQKTNEHQTESKDKLNSQNKKLKIEEDSSSQFGIFPNEESLKNYSISTNELKTSDDDTLTLVPPGEDSLKVIELISDVLNTHDYYNAVIGENSQSQKPASSDFKISQNEEPQVSISQYSEISLKSNVSETPKNSSTKVAEMLEMESSTVEFSDETFPPDSLNEIDASLVEVVTPPAPSFNQPTKTTRYKYQHELFPVMTRPLNPIKHTTPRPSSKPDFIIRDTYESANLSVDVSYNVDVGVEVYPPVRTSKNITACTFDEYRCQNGKCIPLLSRCNMERDCDDNSDEHNCTCSEILRSQHYTRKICDGIIDCWDKSDEQNCEWCTPNHFICSGHQKCIEPLLVCDGTPDCPNGDDERDCVTVAPDAVAANSVDYYDEGYLMVRREGTWGKLCVDNFDNEISKSGVSWSVQDLGEAVCNTLTYDASLQVEKSYDSSPPISRSLNQPYFEIDISFDDLALKSETGSEKANFTVENGGEYDAGTRVENADLTAENRLDGGPGSENITKNSSSGNRAENAETRPENVYFGYWNRSEHRRNLNFGAPTPDLPLDLRAPVPNLPVDFRAPVPNLPVDYLTLTAEAFANKYHKLLEEYRNRLDIESRSTSGHNQRFKRSNRNFGLFFKKLAPQTAQTSIEKIGQNLNDKIGQKLIEKIGLRLKRSSKKADLTLQFKPSKCSSRDVIKVKCKDLQCGVRPRASSLQAKNRSRFARIVGGNNSSPGAWPWHAALYKEGEYQCGATLINEQWLISAGHCFYSARNAYWVARLGALRRGTKFASAFEQTIPISHIFVHPKYVNQGFINDISLLRLTNNVKLNDYVRPVCLPSPRAEVNDGQHCTLVGWGQLFEVKKVFPDTLQEVEVPLISTHECRKRTLFLPLYRITENMFCAGYDRGGRDACLGDSGGPLMCQKNNGQWEIMGVTSNGYGCARPHRPGVYTKVVNYLDWISQVMELSKDGRVVPVRTKCSGIRCSLGECVPDEKICDGKADCSDAADEANCVSSK